MIDAPPVWWPKDARVCFEDLIDYRLVGASSCADRITSALVAVALGSQALKRDICTDLNDAAGLFCGLKPDTALYRNIADSLIHGARGGVAEEVEARARALSDFRKSAQERVVTHTVALVDHADTLLIHDYSSMVLRVVHTLGTKRPRRIVVTAGEPLGQGIRVAQLVAAAGHEVIYTPDMSVARVISEVDGFITGVESFYADGSLANTVGTVMLSLLCRDRGVPTIAPAETLKCADPCLTVTDAPLSARLLHAWPRGGPGPGVDWQVVQLVLDAVPASLISTFVTEDGACTPADVGATARRAQARLRQHWDS